MSYHYISLYDNISLPVSPNITHSPVPCKTALVRTLSTSRKPIAINTWLLSLPTSVKPITNGRTCTWKITHWNIQISTHVFNHASMVNDPQWSSPMFALDTDLSTGLKCAKRFQLRVLQRCARWQPAGALENLALFLGPRRCHFWQQLIFCDLQSHEIWNKRFSSISFSSMFPSSGAPPPGMDGSYTKHWQPEGFFRRIITWMEFKHKAVSSKKVHASICLLLMPTLASSRNGVKFWANQMSFESCWNIQRRTITGSMIVSLFSSFRHCRNTETLPLFGKVTPCSP